MSVIDVDLTGMGRNLHKHTFDPSARVPGFDTTIQDMRLALQNLHARVGGPQRRAGAFTDPMRPWRGVRYWAFALLVGLFTVYVSWITRDVEVDGSPAWVVYGGLGIAIAFYLGLRGAVCFRPRAETLIALDGRAPVIYLRSFRDDGAMVKRPMRLSLDPLRWTYLITEYTRAGFFRVMFHHGKVRLEQAVEDELSALGPFVAIGEPHEGHPDFGATRAYFEGDDVAWRNAVQSWIARAALVVVVPGTTKGLAWELERIQDAGSTGKLLLVFPPERPKHRPARLTALAGMLKDPSWLQTITSSPRTDVLAVFSTERGDLVRVYAQKPQLAEVEFAVELALYGMFCMDSRR